MLVFSALCQTEQVLVSSLRHSVAKLVCTYWLHNGCIVWAKAPGPEGPSFYIAGLIFIVILQNPTPLPPLVPLK